MKLLDILKYLFKSIFSPTLIQSMTVEHVPASSGSSSLLDSPFLTGADDSDLAIHILVGLVTERGRVRAFLDRESGKIIVIKIVPDKEIFLDDTDTETVSRIVDTSKVLLVHV